MARPETPWPVVLVTDDDGNILTHIVCHTQTAAEAAQEESMAKDTFGWWGTYVIKPLTPSELAYLILG